MTTYSPRVDFAFKKLFSEDTDSLMALINAVLPENEHITQITVVNPFNDKSYPEDKLSVLDIKAVDTLGRHYNIEMQVNNEVYYSQRVLYYWSKFYANQLKEGKDYSQLRKTIGIHVLNFNYLDNETDYHNTFHLLNAKTYRREFEDMELHFIELKKFDKDVTQLKSRLDHWASFLTTAGRYDKETMPPQLKNDPEINRVIETLSHLYFNEAEETIYEAQMKRLRDEQGALKSAEIRENRWREKVLAEGMEKGREELNVQKQAIAKGMLAQGLEKTIVAKVTGLSLIEVEKLV